MSVEWAEFWFSLVAAGGAAFWAFFVWRREREKDRQREWNRRAVLYVTPFLLACQDLQSRIYNLLERGGLGPLKERYPDNRYAEETLYLAAQYFAWERCLFRYTLYANDPVVTDACGQIRWAFSTSRYPLDNFCLFRLQQQSLGQLVLERCEGEYGNEFQVISFERFKDTFESHDLACDPGIKNTLDALRAAKSTADLKDFRKRLACVQNGLAVLLEHMECKENIRFMAERRKVLPCEKR